MDRPMADQRKLRDQLVLLEEKERHAKAIEVAAELARLEPENPRWPQKQGDLRRKLGEPALAIAAFCAAARLYLAGGFLVKALALCKQSLALNPKDAVAQQLFTELCAQQHPRRGHRRPAPVAASPVAPASPAGPSAGPAARLPAEKPPRAAAADAVPLKRRTIPPGASLDAVELKALLPEARRQQRPEAEGEVFEIPLEEAIEAAFGGVFEEAAPAAAPASSAIDLPRSTPLFSALDENALRALVEKVALRRFAAGEKIIREGEDGDSLFVIVEGEVLVYQSPRSDPASGSPHRVVLTRLFEGEFFGEIALLTHRPRSATVEAQDEVTALELSRQVMGDLIEDHPEVLKVLLRFFRDRLVDSLIETSELFAPFANQERLALVSRFAFIEVEDAAVLLRRGQDADGLYILLAGKLMAELETGSAELGPGSVAGKTSLLTGCPSSATIRAQGKCWLLKLDRRVFREVIMTHPHVLACLTELVDRRRAQAEVVIEAIPYDEHIIPLL
jgi:CRP-like cAMP-binding protein